MPKIVELTVHEWNESSERHSLLSIALQSSGMTDTKIVDAEFIHDLFQPFGAVTVRRMFGKEALPIPCLRKSDRIRAPSQDRHCSVCHKQSSSGYGDVA